MKSWNINLGSPRPQQPSGPRHRLSEFSGEAGCGAHLACAPSPPSQTPSDLIRDVIDLRVGVTGSDTPIEVGIRHRSMVMPRLRRTPKGGPAREIGQSWAAGDKSAKKEVARALTAAGLTIDDVTATTLERKIKIFEQIERMLASAEARRNNALREIDRHRSAYGAAIRRTLDEVEDVEFRDVETGEVAGGTKQ